ncbi:MAG TPA: peptide ABC transporter substrate-binding protein, partial [Tepidisphaeraceae bacterium]|nr:peptide ABC transporter substrate-binding protein [Tepidisphaeraceae bacterium]
ADFTFINRGDIFTLDINQMSYMQDFRLTYGIREGLYSLDSKTYRPIPAGATGYDLSEDKKIWTFHLRPGCKWSNGDPIRAADYVFSWRRMLEEPGEYSYLFEYIANAKNYKDTYGANSPIDFKTVGIEAPDDLTLRVTLNNPVPYLLDLVAFPPFYPRHEKSMEPFKVMSADGHYSYRNEYTRPPAVVTNGPFVLTRWDFKRRLILEKSETYWDKEHVKSKSVEMVVNDSPLGQYLQYQTGQVDWLADVPGDFAAELKAKGRTDLRSSPAFGTAFLTLLCSPQLPESFGGGKNALADVRVRRALAMAIDKQFIVDNITRMGELPARTYVPPDGTLPGFTWRAGSYDHNSARRYTAEEMRALLARPPGMDGPGLPYNVAEAKRLLADAGYPDGKGFPTFPILFNTESTARAKIAQALENQWKQTLNIDTEVQGLEGKIYHQKTNKKDYVIALVGWFGDYPDASTFTDKYKSTSLQNECDYKSDQYDDLCNRAEKEPDADKRLLMLSQATSMLDDDAPIIPLYHHVNVSMYRDNVFGCETNPRNLTVFKDIRVER